MPFSEALKTSVRRRAHLACCLCHEVGVEVHHIVPQGEGGTDDEDNAAPLCPTCHERYGANPTKRKFIREARDLWFELCAERYAPDPDRLSHIEKALKEVATKSDLDAVFRGIEALAPAVGDPGARWSELPPDLAELRLCPASVARYLGWLYPDVTQCSPAESEHLTDLLLEVDYADVQELHGVLGVTAGVFADFAIGARREGQNLDVHTNSWPAILFLALWDERFCERNYPAVYRKNQTERQPWHWRRRRPA